MLDFGTDMDSREKRDQSDDLFIGEIMDSAEKKNSAEPVIKKEVPVIVQEEVKIPPRRPVLKPPVLPKYVEPENPGESPARTSYAGTHFLHRRRKAEEFAQEDKIEVSRILKSARNSAGLSIADVENATQIREHYIAALENADYDKLPQPVYVLAYLRKLCGLYDIPADEEEILVRPWRQIPCELPDNLSAKVVVDEDNEPRKKVLFHLELALWAAGALLLVGIIVGIVVLISSCVGGRHVPESPFEKSKLLEIQPKPQLIVPEIE